MGIKRILLFLLHSLRASYFDTYFFNMQIIFLAWPSPGLKPSGQGEAALPVCVS